MVTLQCLQLTVGGFLHRMDSIYLRKGGDFKGRTVKLLYNIQYFKVNYVAC